MAELEQRAITARIKQARRQAGLTQGEMADLLHVIPRSVQNYESERVPWRLINEIATITGKSAEWLLHGDAPDLMDRLSDSGSRLEHIESLLDSTVSRLDKIERLLTADTEGREVEEELEDHDDGDDRDDPSADGRAS